MLHIMNFIFIVGFIVILTFIAVTSAFIMNLINGFKYRKNRKCIDRYVYRKQKVFSGGYRYARKRVK